MWFVFWFAGGLGLTTAAGTIVLLIVIELLRDCHVALDFDRTSFGELFLLATSLSAVGEFTLGFGNGRPNVLYCVPLGDGGIGLSVMLLLRFVFDGVDINGRLFSGKLVAEFVFTEFAAEPALVDAFADTVTGVTVTDEFNRGNVGDDVADVLAVERDAFDFDVIGCGALGEVRRWFCCCSTADSEEDKCEIIPLFK